MNILKQDNESMDLFKNLPTDEIKRNKNPMIGPHDKIFKDGVKCKTCKFLVRKPTPARRVFSKCELRGITNGKGTDHSMYYAEDSSS